MNKTRKRTSLEAVLGESTMPQGPTIATSNALGKRPTVKQQTAYLPLPVYEQVRVLAFEEHTKMHAFLMEGLDHVFKIRGLPSIAELTANKR